MVSIRLRIEISAPYHDLRGHLLWSPTLSCSFLPPSFSSRISLWPLVSMSMHSRRLTCLFWCEEACEVSWTKGWSQQQSVIQLGSRPGGFLMVLITSSHHKSIHHVYYSHINVIKMTLRACHFFVQKPSVTHWCLLDEVQRSQPRRYNREWFTLKSSYYKNQRIEDWVLWVKLGPPPPKDTSKS